MAEWRANLESGVDRRVQMMLRASRLCFVRLGAGLAVFCLLVALSLLPPHFSAVHVLVGVAALLTLAASIAAVRSSNGLQPEVLSAKFSSVFGERLDRRMEQLQDAQWALSENEARLKDLLDAQDDMILRRDTQGRLTFVNKAYCEAFGIEAADVLGSAFAPTCLERRILIEDAMNAGLPADSQRARAHELVETVAGPRWISWEPSALRSTGGLAEIQILGRDITAERAADAALTDARDQAEAASRAKSRFLAAMSHEIRTPMNGILGMAGLLRSTPLGPDQDTYVRAIDQSARNLLTLINEILDFSKIEAGKLVLTEAPFELQETVQGAAELMAPLAEEKGLEIVWQVAPSCRGRFLGDEARTRQILLNLISNAIKFTDRGGISVIVDRQGGTADTAESGALVISVKDTGIGMSAADLATIFAEFEQADAAIARHRGGTGLGLAISMQLARAMKGAIEVESRVGEGSTFNCKLTLKPVASVANTIPAPGLQPGSTPRVLLACERVLEREGLARHLEEAGVPTTVCHCKDALAALDDATAHSQPVTRLIVECEGDPRAAGELLIEARKRAAPQPVKGFVLISPLARNGLEAFRREGFSGYLVRPVRPQSMLAQILDGTFVDVSAATEPQIGSAVATAPSPVLPRVLLAEDNAVNRLLATRIIERAQCEVTPAGNGEEAVALVRQATNAKERPFDLILMDMRMPQLDGLGACAAIRSHFALHPDLKCPPIVAVTANAFSEDRANCLKGGMDDYLSKPFDVAELESLLKKWGCMSSDEA